MYILIHSMIDLVQDFTYIKLLFFDRIGELEENLVFSNLKLATMCRVPRLQALRVRKRTAVVVTMSAELLSFNGTYFWGD